MPPFEQTVNALLIVLVLAATVTDLRHRRIPNTLTAPAVLLGILIQTGFGGIESGASSLAGTGLAIGLLALFVVSATRPSRHGESPSETGIRPRMVSDVVVLTTIRYGEQGGRTAMRPYDYATIRGRSLTIFMLMEAAGHEHCCQIAARDQYRGALRGTPRGRANERTRSPSC